jgi:hypothetical protein
MKEVSLYEWVKKNRMHDLGVHKAGLEKKKPRSLVA